MSVKVSTKWEVNYPLVLFAIAQIFAFGWFVSDFNAWRNIADIRIQKNSEEIQAAKAMNTDIRLELSKIQASQASIADSLKEIKSAMGGFKFIYPAQGNDTHR